MIEKLEREIDMWRYGENETAFTGQHWIAKKKLMDLIGRTEFCVEKLGFWVFYWARKWEDEAGDH